MSPSPYGNPANPSGSATPSTSMTTADERNWAVACHLAALSGFIGVPLGHILGPLVVWLIKKDSSNFVDTVGKEVLNYNISLIIWAIVSGILVFVIIGIFFLIALGILDLVVTIMAAQAASRGEVYRYPLTIRFIS